MKYVGLVIDFVYTPREIDSLEIMGIVTAERQLKFGTQPRVYSDEVTLCVAGYAHRQMCRVARTRHPGHLTALRAWENISWRH